MFTHLFGKNGGKAFADIVLHGFAVACGALGWWLERERTRLGVSDKTLTALQALKPNHPQYVLGAKAGDARSVAAWNILVPAELVAPSFEGA